MRAVVAGGTETVADVRIRQVRNARGQLAAVEVRRADAAELTLLGLRDWSYPRRPDQVPVPTVPTVTVSTQGLLNDAAQELYRKLKRKYAVFYDEGGAIGRRYRRQDEIGTPWCVTIDFETIEKDGTFTLRERDSMTQKRISETELFTLLEEQIY